MVGRRGTVLFPATALATSVNVKIANGYYSTVEVYTFRAAKTCIHARDHSELRSLALTCTPDSAVSKLVQGSGYGVVFILPTVKQIALSNGNFNFYSGRCRVGTPTSRAK